MKDKRDVDLEKFKLDRKHETDNAIGEVDKEYLALSEKYKSEHLENDYNTKGQQALIKEVEATRKRIKDTKRAISDANEDVISIEFQRVEKLTQI